MTTIIESPFGEVEARAAASGRGAGVVSETDRPAPEEDGETAV